MVPPGRSPDAPMPTPVLVVMGRDRPHEVMFFVWSVYTALPYLFDWMLPRSLQSTPKTMVLASAVVLLVAGVVGMVGSYWRGDVRVGLELERGALTMRAGMAALLASSVFVFAGWRGLMSGGFLTCLAVADLWRTGVITKDLRRISRGEKRGGGP